MERLTHERVNGIKTGFWTAATKQELIDRLALYENTGVDPANYRLDDDWHLIDEDSPKPGTWCLVTVGTGAGAHVIAAMYGLSFFLAHGDKVNDVVAWMPLPDPYIAKKKGSA